jgi:staphylococcal nuclease domain-containing protein 1
VKTQVNAQSEQSPYLAELLKVEEQAQSEGLGMWNKTPGAAEASIRQLPPSGVGEGSTFDALALLDECKGKAIPAIVEVTDKL